MARKNERILTMAYKTMKRVIVIAIAAATAFSTGTPAWSAPVMSSTAALKSAVPSAVTDVRYRRYYRSNGAGAALGILGVVGAVASAYRHNGYGYDGYGRPYGYPAYYQQGYGGPYYNPGYYGRHGGW
jgi:hypothetical protein